MRTTARRRTMVRATVGATVLAAASLAVSGAGRAADRPVMRRLEVQVERAGEGVEVRVQALVAAPRETAWAVLTDYDHAADIVPGMTGSRVVRREGNVAIVEQTGDAGFIFAPDIALTLRVDETPPERVDMVAVAGSFRRFGAHCELEAVEPRLTRIAYRASFETEHWVPPFVGPLVMRSRVRTQFDAWLHEMERRAGQ